MGALPRQPLSAPACMARHGRGGGWHLRASSLNALQQKCLQAAESILLDGQDVDYQRVEAGTQRH